MPSIRALLIRRPGVAALLLAAALLLRVLVPAGFMPTTQAGALTLAICSGSTPTAPAVAMPGMQHHDEMPNQAPGRCAFADLALPLVGGAPLALVAALLLLAFTVALHFQAQRPPRAAPRLRPPLRGPPTAV